MEARITRAWYMDDVIEEEEDDLEWIGRKGPVRVYLSNGVTIEGRIVNYGDKYIVVSEANTHHYFLVNRNAIVAVESLSKP